MFLIFFPFSTFFLQTARTFLKKENKEIHGRKHENCSLFSYILLKTKYK